MNKTIQRFGILSLSLLLLAISSLGCKTAEGFGKDVEKAGEGIQNGVR
jgi:predicted small secreted protein